MKIIITGAGAVGYHLAKMLSSESQDIYLIDENVDRLQYVASHIDVYTIVGDAKSIKILESAKVDSCDLLIAVTSSEETNLLINKYFVIFVHYILPDNIKGLYKSNKWF